MPCPQVPVEIWQTIFLLLSQTETTPEFDEDEFNCWGRKPQTSSRQPLILPRTPSLLSQVCHQWREYAYGMPFLWDTLFVKTPRYISEYNIAQYQGICELAQRRLTLARSISLTVGLDAKDDTQFASMIIQTLLPFSLQWEKVHIYAPPISLEQLDNLHACDIPRLVSLKTVSPMYVPGRIIPHKSTEIPLTDRISTITRLCTSFPPSADSPVFTFLEELHIQQIRSETLSSMLSILSSCLRLRTLSISGFGLTMTQAGSHLPPDSLLTIPTLEVLNLEHPVGRESLLDLLVLPNLRTLFLCGKCSGGSSQSILDCISHLKVRSSISSLEHLSISFEMHGLTSPTLVDFLRDNTSLISLWIDDAYKSLNEPLVTSYLFDALTQPDNKASAVVCPKLKTLRLTKCSDFEDSKLIDLMNRRCQLDRTKEGEESIMKLYMSVRRKVDTKVLEEVRERRTRGYSITLDTP